MKVAPIDAELAVLGACLMNKKAIFAAAEYIMPADFSSPANGKIFAALMRVITRVGEADYVSLGAELGAELELVGGVGYLTSLGAACPAAANVREYAKAVRHASVDRSVRRVISVANESNLQGTELLADIQDQLYRLDTGEAVASDMGSVWSRLRAMVGVSIPKGCSYPWEALQRGTRGLRPGWLCVLAAESSVGKTAAALAIIEHNLRDSKRVVLVSLEMGEEEVAVRFAQRQGFDSDHYYDGTMTEEDGRAIDRIRASHWWANLQIERVSSVGMLGMLVRRYKPDLLVVDHLQLLDGAEAVATLSQNTRGLKLMAEQFRIPILLLSQLNRVSFEERGARPRLGRLRGSGTIEQDADTVVFIHRERDEEEELSDDGEFINAKARMGRTGSAAFRFDGDWQTFKIIDKTLEKRVPVYTQERF